MMKLSNSFAFTCLCLLLLSCGSQTTTSSPSDFVDGVATALENDGNVDLTAFEWTREPAAFSIDGQTLTVTTAPHTDLWQRTYYHFRNDNAPVFQIQTKEQYFSFVVKTDFTQSHQRFDQCGIVMYLDSDNWLKGSVEFENEAFQHLGSVATNNGYSDWATTAIPADVKTMWYRFSRRADDYCIECSTDGVNFSQMRICHFPAECFSTPQGTFSGVFVTCRAPRASLSAPRSDRAGRPRRPGCRGGSSGRGPGR